MKRSNLFILFMLFVTTSHVFAAPKRITYTGNPIKITLGIGADNERRITFPDAKVVYGMIDDKLKAEGLMDTEIINNNVYLTAIKPFKRTRNIFGVEGGSDTYILDIQAVTGKANRERLIIAKGEDRYAMATKDIEKKKVPETVIAPLKRRSSSPTAGYATLFKYAAREIYAPDRLRGGVSGIYKSSVVNRPVYHLLHDNLVLTKPVAAWRSGPLHITALSVKNLTNKTLILDPRKLRGRWKAALFHYPRLSAQGTPYDTTTLYLISAESFADAISNNPIITVSRR